MKKKIISVFIALFMAACLFAGCDNGNGIVRPPFPPGPGEEQNSGDFTVTLMLDGSVYVPQSGVTATWDDGMSRPVSAPFGADGVARISGLDGDYTVRVNGLPSEFTFDPNNTVATNYQRKITLDIYRAIVLPEFKAPAAGSVLFGAEELKIANPDIGAAYRITLKSALETYYCLYEPLDAGMYCVRSLVDITENAINPKYRICSGTRYGARYEGAVLDGGGASNTYTVNFDYQTGYNYDEMGGILLFGVMAETRTMEFPLTLDILIKRTGDYVRQDIMSNVVVPTEFEGVSNNAESINSFKQKQDAFMRGMENRRKQIMFHEDTLLDGDKVKFNEDTGYYHLYDKEAQTYGPVIWAKISQSCGIIDDPFNGIEYHGNKALTIDDNYDKFYKKTPPKYGSDKEPHYLNYKVFIEGYEGIASHEASFPGISEQYSAYAGTLGYAEMCNSDGVYPVNKELQRFLQGYATNARLFMDGNGWAETSSMRLKSAEEDQWLFACGYYVL